MAVVTRRPVLVDADRELAARAAEQWLREIESPEELQAALDSWEWRTLWGMAGRNRQGVLQVVIHHEIVRTTKGAPTADAGEPTVAEDAEPVAGRLATCSFKGFREEMGAAVRITLYPPRYALPFPLAGSVRELAPTREEFHVYGAAFRELYWRRLGEMGVGWIERRLQALVPHGRIVMLCFEDVWAPDATFALACHRRMLADWLEREAGWTVPELTVPGGSGGSAGRGRPDTHQSLPF